MKFVKGLKRLFWLLLHKIFSCPLDWIIYFYWVFFLDFDRSVFLLIEFSSVVRSVLNLELLVHFVEDPTICVDPLHLRLLRVRLHYRLEQASAARVAFEIDVHWSAVVLNAIQWCAVQSKSPFMCSGQPFIKKYPLLGTLEINQALRTWCSFILKQLTDFFCRPVAKLVWRSNLFGLLWLFKFYFPLGLF